MKIKLYSRKDRYTKPIIVEFIDKNMVLTPNNNLPGLNETFPENGRKYIHFESGYSPVYAHESDGKVNTRITYATQVGSEDRKALYCKLNWFQRQQLSFIERRSLYQKHPIPTLTLIVTTLVAFFGLYKDVFVYKATDNKSDKQSQTQIEISKPTEAADTIYQEKLDDMPSNKDSQIGNDTIND